MMFLLAVVENNTVRSSPQNVRKIFTKIDKFWLSFSSYKFVGGRLFPIFQLFSMQQWKVHFPLFYNVVNIV